MAPRESIPGERKYNPINILIVILSTIAIGVAIILFSRKEGSDLSTGANGASGCISCHEQVDGLIAMHQDIGCVACHLGDNSTKDFTLAHNNMIVIPGNLSDAEQTCGLCHPEAVQAINNSIMTTNSGIVSVDRFIFGESDSPNRYSHIKEIGHSAADEHLRNLCGFCHLGNEKKETGAITELSRGGGCNACHLNYSDNALADHITYKNDSSALPKAHPSLDLNISDDHCFGCHSRSGRISTGYEGLHETLLKQKDIQGNTGYRVLMDDRVFQYIADDIHHSRGLSCIDCHGYYDIMGDGKQYMHEEDAVKISCEDCHSYEFSNTQIFDSLNFIQKRIFKSQEYSHSEKKMLATERGDFPLLNTYLETGGNAYLIGKNNGIQYDLAPPSESCNRAGGHQDLSCSSCHTSWAPQCIGCHVSFDSEAPGYDLLEGRKSNGSWVEYVGEFLAGEATLGVRDSSGNKEIKSAIPGMIMTLDKGSYSKSPYETDTSFFRLFAPAEPHTTSSTGRNCKSCHNSPLTLGYGRGDLRLVEHESIIRWQFTSEYSELPQDSLPADAWTGFLKEPAELVSTRTYFRPFTVEEQKKILTVGACLTCHDEASQVMMNSLENDFSEYMKNLSISCKVPDFSENLSN